jgi:hypothetical protein
MMSGSTDSSTPSTIEMEDDRFECRMENTQVLRTILQHLNVKKRSNMIVNVCAKTVRFIVEESQVCSNSFPFSINLQPRLFEDLASITLAW